MSRAMNLLMPQKEVAELCAALGVVTTSIESLIPRGTRVVCKTVEGSEILFRKVRKSVIEGSITRSPRSLPASW